VCDAAALMSAAVRVLVARPSPTRRERPAGDSSSRAAASTLAGSLAAPARVAGNQSTPARVAAWLVASPIPVALTRSACSASRSVTVRPSPAATAPPGVVCVTDTDAPSVLELRLVLRGVDAGLDHKRPGEVGDRGEALLKLG